MDLVLSEALDMYEAGLCKDCGQPLAYGTDPDHRRDFKVREMTCLPCLQVGFRNEAAGDKPKHGQKVYVANLMSEGG